MHSFAAWGEHATEVTADHGLADSLGEGSPLARIEDLDGSVLLLGTGHEVDTSLHLAEYRADIGASRTTYASPVLVDGEREWVTYEDLAVDDGDFPACGAAFEREHPEHLPTGTVGVAKTRLLDQRPLVGFAVGWLERNRDP
jgi:aminoglycoside 3-N-acetyltransferase